MRDVYEVLKEKESPYRSRRPRAVFIHRYRSWAINFFTAQAAVRTWETETR